MRKPRTTQQNKALWLFFTKLADELNDNGLDMKKVLKPEIDIPWTKQSVHDQIWLPVQKAMTGEESTTEMNTVDPSEIYEVINRHLAEKFGVSVNWPSEEER